jgi:lipopolysaccharide cholinephosphotransferase
MDQKLKITLLGILDKFIQVCEENHLHYYLAYGSVLGTIRHGGIIPWDDDIDVHMPREDYERIQTLPKSLWGDYALTSWKLTPVNQYHFLKVEDTRTTVIEQLYPLYVGGVYLDIFPLDETPNDEEEYKQQLKEIRDIQEKYYTISVRYGKLYKGIANYLKFQWRHYRCLHQHIQEDWERVCTSASTKSGKVIDYHQPNVMKFKPIPKKWFGEGVTKEFEGRRVVIPKEYDAYLTQIYGDYMTPPPLDQRGGHEFVYVNLSERISGKQRKNIIAGIKHDTRFVWRFDDELKYWRIKLKLKEK